MVIYSGMEEIFDDLKIIDGIEIEKLDNGRIAVKKSTIDQIASLKDSATKDRLSIIAMATEFNIPLYIYIDDKLRFASTSHLIYITTHMNRKDNGEWNFDHFRNRISEDLEKNLVIDDVIQDYQDAKLIASIIDDWNRYHSDDPWI
jgi:esterase/lipase